MQLRPYQSECVEAIYRHLRECDTDPLAVIPTGGGKTPVIATICRDAVQLWNGRVLIVAHVKELLEQAADKLRTMAPDVPVGIYSAGLGRRDLGYAVTIAGIQSVHRRAADLGPIDLVIVDEAHLIPPEDDGPAADGGQGMYRQLLAGVRALSPHARVVGLTATPYRMRTGTICGEGSVFGEICYEVGVRELIAQGYLCPLRTRAGAARVDPAGLRVRAGEYAAGEVEDLMDTEALVEAACEEIIEQTSERRSVLIFAAGVRHGEHVARVLRERHGLEVGFVDGGTPAGERERLLDRFRRGELKYLVNVNVLTTGFDAPNVDCVALLRPTLSPGLYYQMVGRGFRLSPGKADCLVLDFGGNVLRHGPVDAVRVSQPGGGGGGARGGAAKECPDCRAIIAAGYAACPECGHAFPPPERERHEPVAASDGILTGQVSRREAEVVSTRYHVHMKRHDPAAALTMRVEYEVGLGQKVCEWVCFDHLGYARTKAEQWWRRRSLEPVPAGVEEAVELAQAGALAEPSSITIERRAGERFERIVGHELGPRPPRLEDPDVRDDESAAYAPVGSIDIPDDEIPF